MSVALHIRDLDEATVQVLKVRAAAAGVSLAAYLRRLLTEAAAQPTTAEVASRAARRRPAGLAMDDVVAAVREGRR